MVEPPPRSAHFVQIVHTRGGVIRGYMRLVKRPCPSTTIRDLYATLCHSDETSMYLHSPYVAVLHQKTTESQLNVQRGLHLDYHSKKFICACVKSSAHAHGNSKAEILNN